MKTFYLVANWKSNKTPAEAIEWLQNVKCQMSNVKLSNNVKIILCAPFTTLQILQEEIERKKIPISLGIQNISPFPSGAYTGEISAQMVKGLAEWVIIGHSERRKYFRETDETLFRKTELARQEQKKVIYCIKNSDIPVPHKVDFIAYEPLAAIGTGKAENSDEAEGVSKKIKERYSGVSVLYGGSVTADNVGEFFMKPSIDGVLIGGASLDPKKFFLLLEKVASYE